MAVEIIDLTGSSPPPTVVDAITEPAVATERAEKKKKKRKSRRERREPREQEEERWKHDKNSDGGRHNRGEKRKRDEEDDYLRRRTKPERSPSPVFAVDTAPSNVVGGLIPPLLATNGLENENETAPLSVAESSSVTNGLLLPAHVILAADESQVDQGDNPPLSPVSEASGIDFVDDDRAVGAPRYFDDRATNPKTRGPCKRCGDSDHDFKQCTTMICLTCGARDEHSPRSCPILRICYNCKGKGHIAMNCPRIGDTDPRRLDRDDCERCGSRKHHGTNCPTIWRIYTYLTDTERDVVLADRESRRLLGFDHGGEGYIARDIWCYNCGRSGHLGDDCEAARGNYDRPSDDSAFGSHNQLTGPFASSSSMAPDIRRGLREWEMDDRFDDGYGFSAQTNVGRKGRENAKAKAREAQRLLDEADDEPDWFNQVASTGTGRGLSKSGSNQIRGLPFKPAPTIVELGFQRSSSSRTPWDPSSRPPLSRPSLRDRIDVGEGGSETSRRRDDRGSKKARDTRRNSGETRTRETSRSHERKRAEDRETAIHGSHRDHNRERGSRWRGGYDR